MDSTHQADGIKNDIDTLNGLIGETLDSIEGYREGAQLEETDKYRDLFLARADEREDVVHKLQAQVVKLGGEELFYGIFDFWG